MNAVLIFGDVRTYNWHFFDKPMAKGRKHPFRGLRATPQNHVTRRGNFENRRKCRQGLRKRPRTTRIGSTENVLCGECKTTEAGTALPDPPELSFYVFGHPRGQALGLGV